MTRRSDKNIVKEYLDIWTKYWIMCAHEYEISRDDISGSSVLDFGIDNPQINIDKCINNFTDTMRNTIQRDWPVGCPWNTSAYIEFPLYMQQLFPIICDKNGLTRPLSPNEKAAMGSRNQFRNDYLKIHIKRYGLPQRFPFLIGAEIYKGR